MVTIRATCQDCGEVALEPDDIELRAGAEHEQATYTFTCPECLSIVVKPADAKVIKLLQSGGVELLAAVPPAPQPRFPESPHFTYDDLLDFHDLLESTDMVTALVLAGETARDAA